jgi:glycosyltransferase involved in cell wall biosynthesis
LDKKIIFFGAARLDVPRKGFAFLRESLTLLARDNYLDLLLVIAGSGIAYQLDAIPIKKVLLGNLNFEELAATYHAADIFVCPTIADSGPTMVNQSIMCGTPVVTFDVGVCMDLVLEKETGILVNKNDSFGLYNGICYCSKQPKYILWLEENRRNV